MHTSKSNINALRYVAAAVFFVIAGFLQYIDSSLPIGWDNICAFLASAIFLSLGVFWAISVKSRIINKHLRVGLVSVAYLFVLLLLLRIFKYEFFLYNSTINRYLWYAYYIPQCLAPVAMLLSVLNIERRDNKPLNKAWFLMFLPAFLLIMFVMTNDYHQLVFSFKPNFEHFSSLYNHEFMYFVIIAWIVGVTLTSIVILFYKCRVSACRKKIWIPLLTFVLCAGFCVWTLLGSLSSYKIPESVGLTFILLFESCIQIGLIPSNSEYKKYFDSSDITAFITNDDFNIKFRAKNAQNINMEILKSIPEQGKTIGDTRFRKQGIHGGNVFWTENISAINSLNEELAEIGNSLSEDNDLIIAKNKLAEQKICIREQNKLYDGIAEIVFPQLEKIKELLNGLDEDSSDYEQRIKLVCIYGAYVKRRSNLVVIGENSKYSKLSELSCVVRESIRYLSLYGIKCTYIGANDDKQVTNKTVVLLYDFIEECIEKALPDLSAMIISLEAKKNNFICRVSLGGATERIDKNWRANALIPYEGNLQTVAEDGNDYITLSLKEEIA